MPGPSPIAAEKAALVEVFESIRRELSYLNTLAATQITILSNEEDLKIMDTVVLHGEIADEHVAHLLALSSEAQALILLMLVEFPP